LKKLFLERSCVRFLSHLMLSRHGPTAVL
jgi:hypothetical protein